MLLYIHSYGFSHQYQCECRSSRLNLSPYAWYWLIPATLKTGVFYNRKVPQTYPDRILCHPLSSFPISTPVLTFSFPRLTPARGITLVRSTSSSLRHFLFLLVVIVLRGTEGRRDGRRGRGRRRRGIVGDFLFPCLPHLPDPPTWQPWPLQAPVESARQPSGWLYPVLADWQDIPSALGTHCKYELIKMYSIVIFFYHYNTV